MIRAISTSDYEFREGYQQAVRSPIYEDQLLQHESTLDIDAIREFNETHGRKSNRDQEMFKEERQITPAVEELQKPRCDYNFTSVTPSSLDLYEEKFSQN
jgi:hypothetical protein